MTDRTEFATGTERAAGRRRREAMKRMISATVIAILYVSAAGAAQALEWSDGLSKPLFDDESGIH